MTPMRSLPNLGPTPSSDDSEYISTKPNLKLQLSSQANQQTQIDLKKKWQPHLHYKGT